MVFCNDCGYLKCYHRTITIPYAWIIDNGLGSSITGFGMNLCSHESCFVEDSINTPEEHIERSVRVKAQGQLNKYNHCKYFKQKNKLVE